VGSVRGEDRQAPRGTYMGTQPETADTDKGNLQCLFDSLLLGEASSRER
jgi:hypothetical protein